MVQYAKTAAVRRGIVESCLAAFAESGFHGVSMAEIARRAGISHTGLLHHFPRKEALLTAVLELQDEHAAAYLAEHGAAAADDPVHALRGMIRTLVERDRYAGLIELGTALTGEATSPTHPAHEHFARRHRNIRAFLTRIYTALREQDRLASTLSPDHLAVLTLATAEGVSTQWLYDREGIDIDAVVLDFLGAIVPEIADHPAA